MIGLNRYDVSIIIGIVCFSVAIYSLIYPVAEISKRLGVTVKVVEVSDQGLESVMLRAWKGTNYVEESK
jgi:hypothetical protein